MEVEMSYVCVYSSVQLDKSRVEKEFTGKYQPLQLRFLSHPVCFLIIGHVGHSNAAYRTKIYLSVLK